MDIEKVAVLEAYKNIKKFFEPRTKNVTITLTPDTSIHATARFDNFKFFVEIFFEKTKLNPTEVILNVYENKDCRWVYGGTFARGLWRN